ncbi:fanconi-associated nuclease 1-like isoform X2 [Dreissena polymorpha]|nr:fanconi-associated nuclease 1-like isoform X2 [Dreissena polymorpha]XP_052244399.1 fanconi-associated nuclease 1-like isoform X2 [Dreissena polymorpha]XP_052244400.1 fanconi-associated nuclease 1-like isoform X2 [Dreissena polymorpha]
MSAQKKRNRLSLKKSPVASTAQNTIVSMFKCQAVKQNQVQKDIIIVSESDSDVDSVTGETEENGNSNGKNCNQYFQAPKNINVESNLDVKKEANYRGSLSKKISTDARNECENKLNAFKSENGKDEESGDNGSESEFKINLKTINSRGEANNTKANLQQSNSESRTYNLRKRTTRLRDSDADNVDTAELNANEKSNCSGEVIKITRKRMMKTSRILSLKKAKIDGVSMEKKESFVGKDLTVDNPIDLTISDSLEVEEMEDIRGKGVHKEKLKSPKRPSIGNFLLKMKQDIEKHEVIKSKDSSKTSTRTLSKKRNRNVNLGEDESSRDRNKVENAMSIKNVEGANHESHFKVSESVKADDDSRDVNIVVTEDKDDVAGGGRVEFQVPYYLENFHTILDSVLSDVVNSKLFDDQDMAYIASFRSLDEASQKLYVRLFSRKLAWLPVSRLAYPEISSELGLQVQRLQEAGLLMSGDHMTDLGLVLKVMSAPDLRALAKSLHIPAQGLPKPRIVELLMKRAKESSISTMFCGKAGSNMEKTILNRALTYLGEVCHLCREARAMFIRAIMLFSLYQTNFDEDSAGGGQNQLFQMLRVNIGQVMYPRYTVNRQRAVFADRAALVRFETALQFDLDLQHLTEKGKWSDALDLYQKARQVAEDVCGNKTYVKWDASLPLFLRCYTAGWVYTRVHTQGLETLQRARQYQEAVDLLEQLLSQDVYGDQYRGLWYERLALNLEAHLKSPDKSLYVILRGLSDTRVHTGRRYAIYERARRLCEAPKSKFAHRIAEFHHEPVQPTPEVEIEGMVISDAGQMGVKYQFVLQVEIEGMVISDAGQMGVKYQFVMAGDADSTTLCAVEELVLEHYKNNGYPEGLHAEGSVVTNLFVLLFWDVMFVDVADVFQGPYQGAPLDLATQDFYRNRSQVVDERLEWIKGASIEELIAEVGRVWTEHNGTMVEGITWEKFSGPDTHQHLVSCMGGLVISGILGRYVRDPRHTRSGFPDLTLWNTDTRTFKICEVKGPNDRLSTKQILWIDFLLKLGVDAEVCYVKAVGAKRLKPVTSMK